MAADGLTQPILGAFSQVESGQAVPARSQLQRRSSNIVQRESLLVVAEEFGVSRNDTRRMLDQGLAVAPAPQPALSRAATSARVEPIIEDLASEGVIVSPEAADYALSCIRDANQTADYEGAKVWLRDPVNATAIAQLGGGYSPHGLSRALSTAGGVAATGERWTRPDSASDPLLLLNPLTAKPGTMLYNISQLLSRVS